MNDSLPPKEFPIYSPPQQRGEMGVTFVKRATEAEFGWIFRKNPQEYDFGIDGYIDLITESGEVTGKSIAVQIKCGASYFKEKTEHGWNYRGELRHINYFMNLPCPVLLILVDPEKAKIWWVDFDPNKTRSTENGWKITVPESNLFERASKNILASLAGDVTNYISQLENLWEFNSLLIKREPVVLIIGREDIEQKVVQPIVDLFNHLQTTSELIARCRGKIEILVHGYDEDKRELYEISEVRDWYSMIEPLVKYWVYFLHIGPESQALLMLYICTSEYSRESRNSVSISRKEINRFLTRHFSWLNEFCEKYNIDESINIDISHKLASFLMPGSPPPVPRGSGS